MARESADCYYIRNPRGHSWARVFMTEGVVTITGEPHYWGYVSVVSDFGLFGHQWAHMGKPLREFLPSLEFSYAMEKLRGAEWKQFDYEASVKLMKKTARDWQRNPGNAPFGKEHCHAIVLVAAMMQERGPMSSEMFVLELESELPAGLADRLDLSDRFVVRTPAPECVGFWNEIWPLLIAELKTE